MTKYLIINADDFGMSKIFNEVILDLIKKDLIRSTTVIINRFTDNQKEQFDELITLSKIKNLSVGLHLEFDDSDYPSQIKSQYKKFKDTLGFNPSHIDIHRVHSLMDSLSDVAEFCRKNNLPLRNSGVLHKGIKTTSAEAFLAVLLILEKSKNGLKHSKTENITKFYFILENLIPVVNQA